MKKAVVLKALKLVFVLTMLAAIVAACSGNSENSGNSQAVSNGEEKQNDEAKKDPEVTIRILTRASGTDPMVPFMKEAMDKFMELHPNVKFQDDSISEEAAYTNKLKADIATGNLPNMFIIYGAAPLAEYAKNGLLMDVTPLLEDKEWADGFVDQNFSYYNLSKYGVEGIYGIPFGYYPEVIFYNKELFEKAGITSKPETMDDLYAAIDKLKAANIIPWGAGAKDTWRAGHIHNNIAYRMVGVDKMKDIGVRKAKWTDPDIVASLQWMKDLKGRGAFDKNFEGIDYETEKAGFFSGKYAMDLNGAWFVADIQNSDIKDKIDFFPFPYLKDKEQFKGDSVLFTNGHVFSGKLEGYEKKITIEWAKFLNSKEMQQIKYDKYNFISSRKDVDTSSVDKPKLMQDLMAYMATVKNPGGDYFDYDTLSTMIDVSRNNIIGMLLGNSAEKAAEEIQKEIDRHN